MGPGAAFKRGARRNLGAMAAPSQSTCAPWATIADVCSPCDDYAVDPALLEDCLQMASDVLFILSGFRYPGACTDTVRPFGECSHGAGTDLQRTADGATWVGPSCTRCGWPYRLRLPRGPVASITSVKIDGALVDAARYRVDNYRDLVFVPESTSAAMQHWPLVQYLERPTTEVGTWEIVYTAGTAPPIGGMKAAAALGCQLALACQPETLGECQLPSGVTQVARQGVTISVLDPAKLAELFKGGATGLPLVDIWLGAENARGAKRPGIVRVPGRKGRFNRTT